jgi:hypothetical protein
VKGNVSVCETVAAMLVEDVAVLGIAHHAQRYIFHFSVFLLIFDGMEPSTEKRDNCLQICDRRLRCGNHKCLSPCHRYF